MSERGNKRATIECYNLYEVLDSRDVAREMKCGVRKIQRMATKGELPMKRFGGEWVITRKRLQEFLDE